MIAAPEYVDELAIYLHSRSTKQANLNSPRISRTASLRRALPHIKAPIKGIWGEFDAPAKGYIHERKELLTSVQPDADFRVVEDAGHWVSYEAAETFNALLVDMLKPNGAAA
jgi:pimeloyl-ACP methyl ester carboxylesterase